MEEVLFQMVSVERVLNYSQLEPEEALETPKDRKPPADWSATGHLVFRDVTLKYKPDPTAVLDHINCKIRPKEKVGVRLGRADRMIFNWSLRDGASLNEKCKNEFSGAGFEPATYGYLCVLYSPPLYQLS
jgi:hypothetical protein